MQFPPCYTCIAHGLSPSTASSAAPRIHRITDGVSDKVERDDREKDRQPRTGRHPPLGEEIAPAAYHRPPFGRRGGCTEAEKAQAGSGRNRPPNIDRGKNDHSWEGVRQDRPPQDAPPGLAPGCRVRGHRSQRGGGATAAAAPPRDAARRARSA